MHAGRQTEACLAAGDDTNCVEVGGWLWRLGCRWAKSGPAYIRSFLPLSLSGTSAGEGTGQEIGGIRG